MSIFAKSRRQNVRNIARTCKSSRGGDCFCFKSDLFRDFHRQFEYASDARLKVGAGYLAAFKCRFQLLGLAVAHLDIVPGENLVGVAAVDAPVCRDHALEAPLIAEHLGEQFMAHRSVAAVDEIVGGHNCPRVGLFDTYLEAAQINLPERALGNSGIAFKAVRLPVVAGKVLYRCGDFLRLDAAHIGGAALSGEEGILGEILEVASAQGIAVDVHRGREPHAEIVFSQLRAARRADFFNEIRVPCAREKRCAGPCGGGHAR